MPVSTGVLTTEAADKFAEALVNGDAMVAPSYFRFGEGGWYDDAGTQRPRTPDAAQLDIDCIENPGLYPAQGRYYFEKAFSPGDVVAESPGICACTCFLDFGEANDDGFANDPEFWEIGVYDSDDVLLAYCTFQMETKNAGKQLEHVVRISFGGA
jgi:hypothetical protein